MTIADLFEPLRRLSRIQDLWDKYKFAEILYFRLWSYGL